MSSVSSFPARRAFTLLEIIIVVAILALLAAILFPAFSRAREKARAATCLSNYKQVGLAIHLYAQDNDDLSPANGGSFAGIVSDCARPIFTRTRFSFARTILTVWKKAAPVRIACRVCIRAAR